MRNQIVAINLRLKYRLSTFSSNPYVRKLANQELKVVNESN